MDHNPYEAPASSFLRDEGELADEVKTPLERDLRIFAGRNGDYYLRKWSPALEGVGKLGFNWAAFLFALIWLPYRKMYRIGFLYCGLFVVETIAETIFVALSPGSAQAVESLGRLVGLVACIYVGGKANGWYLAHARGAIAEVRSEGLPDEEYRIELGRRGGTSLLRGFGMLALFIAAIFAVAIVQEVLGGGLAE